MSHIPEKKCAIKTKMLKTCEMFCNARPTNTNNKPINSRNNNKDIIIMKKDKVKTVVIMDIQNTKINVLQ